MTQRYGAQVGWEPRHGNKDPGHDATYENGSTSLIEFRFKTQKSSAILFGLFGRPGRPLPIRVPLGNLEFTVGASPGFCEFEVNGFKIT
jgi:hypothetical protein